MASHRRPKQPSRARVTIFGATAAAATVAISTQTAQADPAQSIEEVQEEVDRLYQEAEAATEEYNGAKEREEELQSEVEDLQDSTARGQEELNELRGTLGSVASAQYRNGGLDPSVQLFLSSDPDAYLDQASTLDQVSGKQAETLRLIEDRQRTLDQQRQEATDRLAELEDLRVELGDQKETIQGKLSEAQSLLNQLTDEERQRIADEEAAAAAAAADRASRDGESRGDLGGSGGTGTSYGHAALDAAAGKIGAPYVWGATGPSSFDCSGLTSWAFSQAGVSLPRTSQAQAGMGPALGMSELAPGDLVFFYSDLHHVGIYAGNGQIIHAPRPGSSVEYLSINAMPFQYGVRVG
ncbi:NlpC/P60 family protein [Streptomyces sp. MP131-18]|uniref:C40 family peptidase n=1 Tax=Streptomyces sp. MP131-18 TaxID=1857892 RepID=UPI00097C460B|nr:NlpC/P60 family protein [Streptomyces sp. MP131-18]ONK14976.1 putative endopeptidase precursor [Streptomyces sp. MP131-18]